MKISVILVGRQVNDYLKECLTHLKKIRYYDFEVIIVLDEAVNINFGNMQDVFKIIASGPVGPGEKRNIAAAQAKGEILAFIDDDAYPDAHWLRSAANIFEEKKDLYAIGGPGVTPPDVPFEEMLSGKIMESYLASGGTSYRHRQAEEREVDDWPTMNLFVRKSAFDAVGGFNVNFWPGEDTKLCLDLIKMYKKKFLYSPEPLVYHHRRKLFKDHLKQISRYGKHRGWFARVFPKNSRKFAYFIPALFVLGLVFGFIFSIFFPFLMYSYVLTIFVYLTMVFTEAQRVSIDTKDFRSFKYIFFGFILTNVYYGYNFISGFLFKPKLKLRNIDELTGNYNQG